MVGTTISLTDTTGQAWEYVQRALLDAAADNRITLLEVLENIEAGLIIIDAQRLLELSSLDKADADATQSLLSIPAVSRREECLVR